MEHKLAQSSQRAATCLAAGHVLHRSVLLAGRVRRQILADRVRMVLAQTLDAEGEATALATAHRVITLRFFGPRTGGRLPTARTPL